MLVMKEGGIRREFLAADLRNAGWDLDEVRAVVDHVKATYDIEDRYQWTGYLRVARESNPDEVASYNRVAAKAGNLFGSSDEVIESVRIDGSKGRLMVGFHFGH